MYANMDTPLFHVLSRLIANAAPGEVCTSRMGYWQRFSLLLKGRRFVRIFDPRGRSFYVGPPALALDQLLKQRDHETLGYIKHNPREFLQHAKHLTP